MNTLIAAIKDAVYVGVSGFAPETRDGTMADGQEGIACWVGDPGRSDRLQSGGRVPAVRKNEPLSSAAPGENAFRFLPKLQHGHGLHSA